MGAKIIEMEILLTPRRFRIAGFGGRSHFNTLFDMNEFEKFLEENNYEGDLEFQLCDLKIAFDAGKELQWKPSDEQLYTLEKATHIVGSKYKSCLASLYQELKKLREE